MNRLHSVFCAAAVFSTMTGCADAPSATDDDTSFVDQEIINGQDATGLGEALVGLVIIDDGTCTGTLLSSTLVLTAAHCVGATNSVHSATFVGQRRVGHAVVAPNGADYAVIRLGTRMIQPLNGLLYSKPTNLQLFNGSLALTASSKSTLTCCGQGGNTISGGNIVGAGTIRCNTVTAVGLEGSALRVVPGATGGILTPGDSGGPCLMQNSNGTITNIVGINGSAVTVFNDRNRNNIIDPGEITGIESASLPGVDPAIRSWLTLLMAQNP